MLTPTGLAAQIAHTRSRANTDDLWRMLPLPYSVPVPAEASAWLHVTGFDSNPVINDTAGAAASLGAALDALPAEAGWNVLFAHHLLMSDAAHGQGDAEQRARLDRALAPRLGPGKAEVLLSGHDHVQQVLVHDDPAYIQVIEGNSSRARGLCATPVHPGWTSLWARGQAGTGCDHNYKGTEPRATGFMILDATPARLDLHAYDAAGCQLHHSAFALAEGGDLTVASDETAAPGACLAE